MITWKALLVQDKYRGGHSHPAIELSTGCTMGELEKGHKELKVFATPKKEQQCESPSTPRAPRDKTINQKVHMELPMAPDTYAAEDGLVRHQREVERLDAAV